VVKQRLDEALEKFLIPIRDRRDQYRSNTKQVYEIVRERHPQRLSSSAGYNGRSLQSDEDYV
jgi:hypothetical protein